MHYGPVILCLNSISILLAGSRKKVFFRLCTLLIFYNLPKHYFYIPKKLQDVLEQRAHCSEKLLLGCKTLDILPLGLIREVIFVFFFLIRCIWWPDLNKDEYALGLIRFSAFITKVLSSTKSFTFSLHLPRALLLRKLLSVFELMAS